MTTESPHERDPHGYLSRQLIAYLGNKRRVLPSLHQVFLRAVENAGKESPAGMVFLDPFSGSGAVSRLARFMGFTVLANDWEPYAHIVNRAHLTVSRAEGAALYGDFGGGERAFAFFNSLASKPGYIARTYAPKSTEAADYRTERLFYTAENGAFIDTVRDEVEERWPGWDLPETGLREKSLLVSALVYEAATHVNTSGVFKACHKGFGGHGRDALTRILSPMNLEFPVLFDGAQGCTAERLDAADFLSSRSGDICYLDPPYTIHQYGSNYHLLNSIVLWDKPFVSNRLDPSGRLVDKAGIRGDWKRTKSRFCSRTTAAAALDEILDRVDARSIVLSYNTDGLVGMDELREMLARQGKVEFFAGGYPAYRGGRQSRNRRIHTMEIQFLVTRVTREGRGVTIGAVSQPAFGSSAASGASTNAMTEGTSDFSALEDEFRRKELEILLRRPYMPERLAKEFSLAADRERSGDEWVYDDKERLQEPFGLIRGRFRFVEPFPDLSAWPAQRVVTVSGLLKRAVCADNAEECAVFLDLISNLCRSSAEAHGSRGDNRGNGEAESRFLVNGFLTTLRRLAHRKYAEIFTDLVSRGRALALCPGPSAIRLLEGLDRLEDLFSTRISG